MIFHEKQRRDRHTTKGNRPIPESQGAEKRVIREDASSSKALKTFAAGVMLGGVLLSPGSAKPDACTYELSFFTPVPAVRKSTPEKQYEHALRAAQISAYILPGSPLLYPTLAAYSQALLKNIDAVNCLIAITDCGFCNCAQCYCTACPADCSPTPPAGPPPPSGCGGPSRGGMR